ncbi:hypothetical protein N9B54_01735 [Mariniblastus sp.]|nr:hypothetical protein [Mariniblastus sp.]
MSRPNSRRTNQPTERKVVQRGGGVIDLDLSKTSLSDKDFFTSTGFVPMTVDTKQFTP